MRYLMTAAAGAAFLCAIGAADTHGQGALFAAAAAQPAAMAPLDYVTEAARADMYEVQAGRMAKSKATSPQVKDFGDMMVRDHTATTRLMQNALAHAGMQAPPDIQLDPRRQEMLSRLDAAQGPNFDRLYLSQQLAAHQEALALHQNFAAATDNGVLKGVAQQIAPKVQQHLQMLQQMGPG
jgi:putative membrane protein